MTYTSAHQKKPVSLQISKLVDSIDFILQGQGVFFFTAEGPCSFMLWNKAQTEGIQLTFTETSVIVQLEPSKEPLLDIKCSRGLTTQRGAYYWFSLDSQNQRLYSGIGEARIETVTYSYQLEPSTKTFLESLCSVQKMSSPVITTFTRILRDPIQKSIPLLVKNTDELTMESISQNCYMPRANLSLTSQCLFDCIAGKQFKLETPDFPEFAQAIEHSIATPGKWCYETLKKKATEFNKDKPNTEETYLRITLGENNGESPGVPYVMEIWPVGHYSPIHNHGGSSAIIRVLHGTIQVSLFPFLSDDALIPFAQTTFKKEDITWISPTLNQVHQLKNLPGNKETCITIQCYMYESSDKEHHDYFDYIESNKGIQYFEPDSDMEFLKFKATMKKEWAEFRASKSKVSFFC